MKVITVISWYLSLSILPLLPVTFLGVPGIDGTIEKIDMETVSLTSLFPNLGTQIAGLQEKVGIYLDATHEKMVTVATSFITMPLSNPSYSKNFEAALKSLKSLAKVTQKWPSLKKSRERKEALLSSLLSTLFFFQTIQEITTKQIEEKHKKVVFLRAQGVKAKKMRLPWLLTKPNYPPEEDVIKAPINLGTFFPQIKPAIKKVQRTFSSQFTPKENAICALIYAQINQSIGTGAYRFIYYNLLVLINILNSQGPDSISASSKQYAIDAVYAIAIQVAWAVFLFEENIQYFMPYKKEFDPLLQLIELENKYRLILDNKANGRIHCSTTYRRLDLVSFLRNKKSISEYNKLKETIRLEPFGVVSDT